MKTSLENTKGQEINQIYGEYLAQILQVLISVPLKNPPLSSPHSDIINTLMNIPVIDETLYFPENSMKALEVLLEIFSKSFQFIASEKDIPDDVFQAPNDQALIPLCIVLKKLAANSEAKAIMKSVMVPPNIDRTRNLTIGPGLTAALVRAMTSAYLSQTRSFLGELLLSLFDDSGTFLTQ
jgi:Guanine nucleotide exchange factor synembryn